MKDHSMNYSDVLLKFAENQDKARKVLNPSCRMCKICDGVACAGKFTNVLEFGSKGNNGGFKEAVRALDRIKIEIDPIHDDFMPDTRTTVFGREFDLPVFASPAAIVLTNHVFDSPYFNNNDKYAAALLKGCYDAGGWAWLGDCKLPEYLEGQVATIKDCEGLGIPTVKPWANWTEYWRKFEVAKNSGAFAIATDVDAIGLGYQYSGAVGDRNVGVCARDVSDLKEAVKRAEGIPFVVKGIMSVSAALKAAEAGASGILISNHGGNIIEGSRGPCDVVKEIKAAVGDSMTVFADGGVRSGEDVFKMLALGADAVGICRPYISSVYGAGAEGAYIYTQKIYWELGNIMRLTGCHNLAEITEDKLYYNK